MPKQNFNLRGGIAEEASLNGACKTLSCLNLYCWFDSSPRSNLPVPVLAESKHCKPFIFGMSALIARESTQSKLKEPDSRGGQFNFLSVGVMAAHLPLKQGVKVQIFTDIHLYQRPNAVAEVDLRAGAFLRESAKIMRKCGAFIHAEGFPVIQIRRGSKSEQKPDLFRRAK